MSIIKVDYGNIGGGSQGVDILPFVTKAANTSGITIENIPHKPVYFILVDASNTTGWMYYYTPDEPNKLTEYNLTSNTPTGTSYTPTITITDDTITIAPYAYSGAATKFRPIVIY